ncbi:MAG TPA: hypothetical protein VF320_11735 [Acidimicrobiales bacterium]
MGHGQRGPGSDLPHTEGILATAMHSVNAVPGIRTYLDLPLMPGRAAS